MNRDRIVDDVTRAMENKITDTLPIDRACLYWADAVVNRLKIEGVKAVCVAGTMCWPFIDLSQDDGISNTHFSFEWQENNLEALNLLMEGLMPEVHVWVYLPDRLEIIDLTTKYFQKHAEGLGYKWSGPLPPKYLWCSVYEIPNGVIYKPYRIPTRLVPKMLEMAGEYRVLPEHFKLTSTI